MKSFARCVWEQKVMDRRGEGINDGMAELKAAIPLVAALAISTIVVREINKELQKHL